MDTTAKPRNKPKRSDERVAAMKWAIARQEAKKLRRMVEIAEEKLADRRQRLEVAEREEAMCRRALDALSGSGKVQQGDGQ